MEKKLPSNEEIELIEGNVKVVLSWREGINGDYNSDDPEDLPELPILRFDVYAHERIGNPYAVASNEVWEVMPDFSYCTRLVAMNKEISRKAIRKIMDEVKEAVENWHSTKKICEKLSWLIGTDFK